MPAGLYQKRGWWYAPSWRNPYTGELHPKRALGTADEDEADRIWSEWKAAEYAKTAPERNARAKQPELPIVGRSAGNVLLSKAVVDYLDVKKKKLAATSRHAYEHSYLPSILARLPDRLVSALAPPDGTRALSKMYDLCRTQGVTNHTLWKWFYGLLKPALAHAVEQRWLVELPRFPDFVSDYEETGRRDKILSPEEVAALRARMPPVALIVGTRTHLQDLVVVGACTGMHTADLLRLRGAHWRQLARQWQRINRKGARRYRPEWFACEPMMTAVLEAAHALRMWGPEDGILVEGWKEIAQEHVRDDGKRERAWGAALNLLFARASKAAGLPMRISPIWLRHFFAAQMRDRGWQPAETAKVLGNSGGIVELVYAAVPSARIAERVRASDFSAVMARAIEEHPARADERVPLRAPSAPSRAAEATGTYGRAEPPPAAVLQFPETMKRKRPKGGHRQEKSVVQEQRVWRDVDGYDWQQGSGEAMRAEREDFAALMARRRLEAGAAA